MLGCCFNSPWRRLLHVQDHFFSSGFTHCRRSVITSSSRSTTMTTSRMRQNHTKGHYHAKHHRYDDWTNHTTTITSSFTNKLWTRIGPQWLFSTCNNNNNKSASEKLHEIIENYRQANYSQTILPRFVKQMVRAADENKDGMISVMELEKLLRNIGAHNVLTPTEIQSMMESLGCTNPPVVSTTTKLDGDSSSNTKPPPPPPPHVDDTIRIPVDRVIDLFQLRNTHTITATEPKQEPNTS